MTITKDAWAEQKSNTILKTHRQMKVNNKEKNTQITIDLPATIGRDTNTNEPQKTVASTTNPPVVTSLPTLVFVASPPSVTGSLPRFTMQEDDASPQTQDRLVDNTQAKMLTQTITQDFAQQALQEEMMTSQDKVGGEMIKLTPQVQTIMEPFIRQ